METIELSVGNGVELFARTFGQGPDATVLVHGWNVSGYIWDETVKRWPASLGKLVVPDLRGAGWSSKPASGYSLEAYAGDVSALVKHLLANGSSSVRLVGNSMGGAVAQLVALDAELALRKLVLVSPVPGSGVPLPPEALAFFRSAAGKRSASRAVIGSAMAKAPDDVVFERILDGSASVRVEACLESFDAWRNASFADRIGAIKATTVVLGGDAEPYMPPAFLNEAVTSKIPGATFVALPGAGHYPMAETPDLFVEHLVNALG